VGARTQAVKGLNGGNLTQRSYLELLVINLNRWKTKTSGDIMRILKNLHTSTFRTKLEKA
jgi:hypothetical protein